jgi:hypothetical protein
MEPNFAELFPAAFPEAAAEPELPSLLPKFSLPQFYN